MPAPSVPRVVGSLATVALTAGLLFAPVLAHADPTPTPATNSPTHEASSPTPEVQSPAPVTGSPEAEAGSPATDEPVDASPKAADAEDPSTGAAARGSKAADSVSSDANLKPTGDPKALPGSGSLRAATVAEDQVESQASSDPPAISLVKSASRDSVSKLGQVITYTFDVRNTGGVELTDVEITDELDGLSKLTCNQAIPASLQPAQTLNCTATLTVTQDWLDFGDIDNSATVFGYFVDGDSGELNYRSDNATAHVAVDQKPSIALDASVSPTGTADAGDRLRYRATATNTGNVTLTAARITSSLDALDLDCEPSARTTLSPGESLDCSGSYRVTRSDARRGRVSNLLTARAEGPYGDPSSRGDDVTDDVRLRVAVNKLTAEDSDSGLADTGGPGGALPVGVLGVAALLVGAGLLRRGVRR